MFGRLFRRDSDAAAIATAVYGAIVAQARNPLLYSAFGVPDTVTGRFEMVTLHLILVLDRWRSDAAERGLGQAIFDLYCTDMDNSLRELGFGDLGVPKRMKKMGEAFYGRAAAYRAALDAGDQPGLEDALVRNVFGGINSPAVRAVAAYVMQSATGLTAAKAAVVETGRVSFADLSQFIPTERTPA